MTEHSTFAAALRAKLESTSGPPVVVLDGPTTDDLDTTAEADLLVLLPTTWTAADLTELSDRAPGPSIALRQDAAVTVLGPVVGPGQPGCLRCAEHARLRMLTLPGDPMLLTFGGQPSPTSLPLLAALITAVARDPNIAPGTVWTLGPAANVVSAHQVAPDPDCPRCHPMLDDTAAGATFTPVPRPVGTSSELRAPNPAVEGDRLNRALITGGFGTVIRLNDIDAAPVPLASAVTVAGGRHEYGYGRGASVAEARRTALFEAVERRAALRPHGRRTVLRASYEDLGPQVAIDPSTLGLSDPRHHGHPAFRLTPYRPDAVTNWVYGWSMTRERAVAVPEHVAYYGLRASRSAPHFVDERSNGCGTGSSLEEAALYGLFEVVERDAFLLAWHARTPLHRVAPPSSDELTWHLVQKTTRAGYDLQFFDATNDLALPVVLSLALRRDGTPAGLHAYFSAGAHPDPRVALRSAAMEAAVGLHAAARMARDLTSRDSARIRRMLTDPTEVRTIDDHVALNALPEARPRYEFLLDGPGPVDWRELWPGQPAPVTDLTEVLTGLIEHLAGRGLETVVVDQTDPWIRARLGLRSAKVIVPGTLPMTFGYVHQRTVGLPRLLHVPFQLGRAPAVLDYADLPLHPHPFP
ncbi:TOMM precursor leader peptide-binding protein [Cryptosporangium aurantiacum]|uniref:Ribosomal protein S12 methylthiotransferase accessory factor n=1 Tax=Cryptosporangium aurantiacum TaxID=134849 RepID=A0A1M7RNF6_9ACTN|nr:TOMM precursor leader peptide-binding protein [Cryptosporangium aurantiacum]SHN47622.1 ribosomal protein S12 methylthiotransferase accessory factor [Cryptosporangium aurantiacum]